MIGMKSGWISLFFFVWIIGAFLGSTFEYQTTVVAAGVPLTGNATFNYDNITVTKTFGANWDNATMANGLIKLNATGVWYKIKVVTAITSLNLTAPYNSQNATGGNTTTGAFTMQASPGWAGTGKGGYAQSPITTFQYLTNLSNALQNVPLVGSIALPVPNGDYFSTAFKVLTWRWSFLVGYPMFYYIFCAPFVMMGVVYIIGIIYGLIGGIFRGVDVMIFCGL